MRPFPRLSSLATILAAVIASTCFVERVDAGTHTIGYLSYSPKWTGEDSAAVRWLSSNPKFNLKTLDMDGGFPDLGGIGVLWVHIPDSADFARWQPRFSQWKKLKSWYESGGRFLFTGLAAMIPAAAGIETVSPAIRGFDIENDWLFDQKGFQGFRATISAVGGGHPVFDGLLGGSFTWDADSNHRLWCAGYFGSDFPAVGKVAAVEKAYITISADRRLVIEYDGGKGRGIAAGGFIYFGRRNNRRANMEKFIGNALLYAAGEPVEGRAAYWTPSDLKPVREDVPPPIREVLMSGDFQGRAISSDRWPGASSGLLIARDTASQNFYDVAGPMTLVMGNERGGIDELWMHPFRLLRDYRAGIVTGDSILWLNALSPRIEIRPESFTRIYPTPFGPLKEIVFASRTDPAAIVRYEFSGTGQMRLAVKFRSDLRLMWPYDAPATGALRYSFETVTGTFLVSDEIGEMNGAMGGDAVPSASITGTFDSVWWSKGRLDATLTDANQVYHAAVYDLSADRRPSLTIAMTGGIEGRTPSLAITKLPGILTNPADVLEGVVRHYRELLGASVTIGSPDREFNELFKWALVGADRFVAFTPGVGLGLLAGYSTTARGWDGAQKISGRPGYGWYFGRDAEWSGFAMDDYGDLRTVESQLQLLERYQDLSGKIFHEISTSGSVHYDASDATPLYVILAAHHLRAAGDSRAFEARWNNIERAMDYLYSTDTDADLLIENTNQGHGWVEGGKLYPVHSEFYLAGVWCQALLDASYMASKVGKKDLSEKYRRDGGKVREILNRDFWNDQTKFFNFGKRADGSYNPEPTVLPAVVMHFGLLDDEKAGPVLEQYAGAGFSSDWGVRIVSSSSPLFNPQGYHYGSVWPLFTGWTALAEYEYGNSTQGFTHILNNLCIKNHWALGFVEEVMSGAVYQPSGVCPHQCWSETNILHPAITGMVGWKPDAPDNSAGLYPRFPVQWDSVKVKNLRMGRSTVDFTMVRRANRTVYTFDMPPGETGAPAIHFAPEIPEGMSITSVTLNGRTIPMPAGRKRGRRGLLDPPIEIKLQDRAELVLEHTGGIGVVPAMPRPEPGDSSTGHRIISASLEGDVYSVVLEGKPGRMATLELETFDQSVTGVDNATMRGERRTGRSVLEVKFPGSPESYVRITLKIALSRE